MYSPPGAEEEKAPLTTETSVYSPPTVGQPTVNTSADEFAALAAAQEDSSEEEEEGDEEGEDRCHEVISRRRRGRRGTGIATLSSRRRVDGVERCKFDVHTGDDPEDRQARKYVGSALKPAKKAALERLVEQLQRDNDRLQASLQLAYERAEASKAEWEAVRSPRFEVLRCLHFMQTRRLQE